MHSRFYAPGLRDDSTTVELPADEAEHLSRVLRLAPGAVVRVFDGRGREVEGRLERVERKRAVVSVEREVPTAGLESMVRIVLAQALLKGDAMDQVVRDAVMLGVAEIVPLVTARCETSPKKVRDGGRVERWTRIAVASAKQCQRAVVPSVSEPVAFDSLVARAAAAPSYLLAEPSLASDDDAAPVALGLGALVPPPATVTLIAGPEGGWTTAEVALAVAAGCRLVSLGRRTLRADAAAMVGLAALQCAWGEYSDPVRTATGQMSRPRVSSSHRPTDESHADTATRQRLD